MRKYSVHPAHALKPSPGSARTRHRRQLLAAAAVAAAAAGGTFAAIGGNASAVASAPAHIQGTAAYGSGTSFSISTPSSVISGHLLTLTLVWDGPSAPSLSDNRGDTIATAASRTTWGNGYSMATYYVANAKGGATTLTAKFASANGAVDGYVDEYAGISSSAPVDGAASTAGTSKSVTAGSVRTTAANDLVFVAVGSDGAASASSDFTSRSTFDGDLIEDKVAGAAGTVAPTASQTGTHWVAQTVAFKAATTSTASTPSGSAKTSSKAAAALGGAAATTRPAQSAPTTASTTAVPTATVPSTTAAPSSSAAKSSTAGPSTTAPAASSSAPAAGGTSADPTAAGVIAGSSLTTVNGDLLVSASNTTISNKHITGSLYITGSNVQISNVKVDGVVQIDYTPSGSYVYPVPSAISLTNVTTAGIFTIGFDGLTLNAVQVVGSKDASMAQIFAYQDSQGRTYPAKNLVIENSWFHGQVPSTTTQHLENIHIAGVQGATIVNNRLDMTVDSATLQYVTGSVVLGAEWGGAYTSNIVIKNNTIIGGGYYQLYYVSEGSADEVSGNQFISTGDPNFVQVQYPVSAYGADALPPGGVYPRFTSTGNTLNGKPVTLDGAK